MCTFAAVNYQERLWNVISGIAKINEPNWIITLLFYY